uniref:Uncharacterized protein n=1 Tax=Arundo donax TaxID=35708 RepID=A0A0A8YW35_ARUDO
MPSYFEVVLHES